MLELRSPRGHGSLPSDGSEPNGGNNMAGEVNRRDFLSTLGVSVGAALTASAGSVIPSVGVAHAQEKPKGNIPDTPYKIGHMTFFTGPAAVLGEPMYKGQLLAAEEINAAGGLLGKRKIEILKADEAEGTDANVKELGRQSTRLNSSHGSISYAVFCL